MDPIQVYGGYRREDMPVTETTPKRAGSILGLTRIEAERLVEEARGCPRDTTERIYQEKPKAHEGSEENGKTVDSVLLRFSENYGSVAGDKIRGGQHFVTQLVHAAIRKTPIRFVNKQTLLDLLHVEDAVDSVLLSIALLDRRQMQRPPPPPDCNFDFNIASSFAPSVSTYPLLFLPPPPCPS